MVQNVHIFHAIIALFNESTLSNSLQTHTKNCCAFSAKQQEKRNNFFIRQCGKAGAI